MRFFPLGVELRDRRCLLVGGGEIALRRARLLTVAGARLRVVAEGVSAELTELAAAGGEVLRRAYKTEDCRDVALVIAASEDRQLNGRVAKDAHAAGVLVNAVDERELCSAIFPALLRRPPLWFAIGSDGESPLLARWWRSRLNRWIPEHFGRVARLIAELKEPVRQRLRGRSSLVFWDRVLGGIAVQHELRGDHAAAIAEVERALGDEQESGEVWLVGAGPGDPDLLSLRALQLMQQADIVFYDRLVSAAVLERVRREATLVCVGKSSHCHPVGQDEIHRLLIEHARKGRKVLRLKGGDPFVFGRGGEEIETLKAAGIAFQVVPGISAASGCAAYAGIPLTHRQHASAVRFLSAHLRDGTLQLPWASLMDEDETLVFFMSSESLELLCRELIAHGRPADTPAAMITQGTVPAQRVVSSTLAELPQRVRQAELQPPGLTIVGRVVMLRQALDWRPESSQPQPDFAGAADSR